MSILTIRLPESLHVKLKAHTEAEGISINHFLVEAAAEKLSPFLTTARVAPDRRQRQQEDDER